MKQPSFLCSCISCKKPFSSFGIDTHYMRIHGTSDQSSMFKNSGKYGKDKSKRLQFLYSKSPRSCQECSKILTYKQRHNLFCSHVCSAKYSNRKRENEGWTHSTDSIERISNKLSIYAGPYTKIYFRSCKFCESIFITPKQNKVCKNCQHLKWKNNKDQFSFKFNIFNYPDLFDLSLLKSVGWVSFGGKRGEKLNLSGLSRDHKVSVAEAKIFKYDPYYISHPLNCELMPHVKNNKKKTKSSITYEELVRLVDEYDGVKDQTRTG